MAANHATSGHTTSAHAIPTIRLLTGLTPAISSPGIGALNAGRAHDAQARDVLADVDIDADQDERPNQDGDQKLEDGLEAVEVVEVVLYGGHDDANDQVERPVSAAS